MKRKYLYLGIGFGLVLFLLGCATTTPSSSDALVNDYGYYKIYKKNKSFYVIQNGSVIYENLKYVSPGVDKIYALNKNNKKTILKVKYKEVTPSKDLPLLVCGNSEYLQTISIEEKKHSLNIMAKVELSYSGKKIKDNRQIIAILKSKADRIYFSDNTTKLDIDGETLSNVYLYFQNGAKYGFLGKIDSSYANGKFIHTFIKNSNTMLYDKLTIVDAWAGHFLLKKDALFGYYFRDDNRMIPLKYKLPLVFDFNEYGLARFELSDGRKGYVDKKGNEYYD